MEALLAWLQWAETTLNEKDKEDIPQEIEEVKALIAEHQVSSAHPSPLATAASFSPFSSVKRLLCVAFLHLAYSPTPGSWRSAAALKPLSSEFPTGPLQNSYIGLFEVTFGSIAPRWLLYHLLSSNRELCSLLFLSANKTAPCTASSLASLTLHSFNWQLTLLCCGCISSLSQDDHQYFTSYLKCLGYFPHIAGQNT